MLISLADAAARLQRSVRQIRYQLKKGELPAQKVGGVWMIDEADLPTSPADVRRRAEKVADLQQTVQEALAPHVRPELRYSVLSIRAYTELIAAAAQARQALPSDHPALTSLAQAALALSRGAHAFRGRAKVEGFEAARDRVSEAVAWLHLDPGVGGRPIADHLEAAVLPGLGGLVRRSEGRSAR